MGITPKTHELVSSTAVLKYVYAKQKLKLRHNFRRKRLQSETLERNESIKIDGSTIRYEQAENSPRKTTVRTFFKEPVPQKIFLRHAVNKIQT